MVHKLLMTLDVFKERAVDMEDYATVRRIKLEQCVQLATFKTDANQVRERQEEFAKLNFSVTLN